MKRLVPFVLPLALLFIPSCGGGGGASSTSTIVKGPAVLAVPFLPDAVSNGLVLGLRNLSTSDTTVTVTAHLPGGGAYPPGPVSVALPGQGGVESPLATFTGATGGAGGWIEVETRDVTTLDPVTGEPTPVDATGFVAAYVRRSESGGETDAGLAAAFRADAVYADLNGNSLAYQLVNRSFDPMAGGAVPEAVDVDVRLYDALGGLVSTASVLLPANGSSVFVPATQTGQVVVTPTPAPGQSAPATTEFRLAVATMEADPQVLIESRLMDVDRGIVQRSVGFDLEFGRDTYGNAFDFEVVITNPTDSDAVLQLRSIRRATGAAILATPRVVSLGPHRTKVLATTTTESRGLEDFEASPFDDLFGDVGAVSVSDLDVFYLDFSVPEEIEISARAYDSLFKSFYRILPGGRLTSDAAVLGVDVESSLASGTRNTISLMNPGGGRLTVNVRGFTPGSTEYVLDPIVLEPYERIDWSPDGQIFREEPTDTVGPAVPFMAFRFSSSGGLYVGARRERRDAGGLILSITPQPVRDLRGE